MYTAYYYTQYTHTLMYTYVLGRLKLALSPGQPILVNIIINVF